MTREDFEETMAHLKAESELVKKSKEAARAFLVRAGILTSEGYLAERFKELNEYGPNKGKPYRNVRY